MKIPEKFRTIALEGEQTSGMDEYGTLIRELSPEQEKINQILNYLERLKMFRCDGSINGEKCEKCGEYFKDDTFNHHIC